MHKNGFTLIELLVSISILLLLTVLGLTSMFSFYDRQQIIQAEEMVAEAVYRAQSLARSGKMNGCNRLDGYQIQFTVNNPTGIISIQSECAGGTLGDAVTINLPSNVSFANSTVIVKVQAENGILDDDLNRATQAVEFFTLTLTGNYKDDWRFILSKGGELSGGEWI